MDYSVNTYILQRAGSRKDGPMKVKTNMWIWLSQPPIKGTHIQIGVRFYEIIKVIEVANKGGEFIIHVLENDEQSTDMSLRQTG